MKSTDYQNLLQNHEQEHDKLQKQYNLIGTVRLGLVAVMLVMAYFAVAQKNNAFWVVCALAWLGFMVAYKKHQRVQRQRNLLRQLIQINKDEIAYLNRTKISFAEGQEFVDPQHPYTYDLDIFGQRSLFHNLNRTYTFIGKHSFANLLKGILPNEDILHNQNAVAELKDKTAWRQHIAALARSKNDTGKKYTQLIEWASSPAEQLPGYARVLSFAGPALFMAAVLWSIVTGSYHSAITWLFLFNAGYFFSHIKKVKAITDFSDEIDVILKNYGDILQSIEQENFTSEKNLSLQTQVTSGTETASGQIRQLSALFSDLNNTSNPLGAMLVNGVCMYHLHRLHNLYAWKAKHAQQITQWLNVIGQFEALNSLANYAANNPGFVFPHINNNGQITFKDLGHPLIPETVRVCNDISFTQQPFRILTGSNMSGKSTFLRTLGINMVLAGTGAPVCAKQATIHPLPVLVSMRQSDSLADSESYFFAEVKRLKQIIVALQGQKSFVLLDEILKGTNSDDKQSGTIGVIKKIIAQNGTGVIATHDIEVCDTSNDYPDYLKNQCFEVQITNNELVFDYTLRDGICQNKSATFLMKKMEIIS
ncbi:MutS-related protein [Flavobacterium psychrotrophum]|uniref:MutS-related protein n=1 Tax=Flavobacterium psychrotrophum TaxID=2294119 RepID=UPI001F093088|nr:DNA mismatch repair protein [Flavobacterium psychrotrophum]